MLLAAAALTACGGGSSTPSAAATLSGKVIDGYIEGATVCLDLNNNQACDSSEPSAKTGADGSYKLDISSVSADVLKTAHLFTVVPTTAKDADDAGKTLAEAGKSGFNLLAPAAAFSAGSDGSISGAVVSPLTTLVSHQMLTSKTTLDTSEKYVRERLNLATNTDLRQDFVAQKDAALTEKAQMLASAIGEVKAKALADTTSKPTDQQALVAALTYLQTQVANLQTAYDAAKASNSSAKPAALAKTAVAADAAKVDPASLVAEAKKTTDSTAVTSSTLETIINAGFYGADHVLENCGTGNSSCTPYYWKVQGSGGKVTLDNDYDLIGGAWVKQTGSSSNSLELDSKGQWVPENGGTTTYSVDSSGVATVTFGSGRTERMTTRKVDASGKTFKELGLTTPTGYDTITMPSGSELYWLELASNQDKYYLYTGNKVSGYSSSSNSQVNYTTLADYIKAYTTATTTYPVYTGWSGLCYSFDSTGRSDAGGNLTLWSCNSSSSSKIGTSTYEIRTVSGQQMLIIKAQAPENGLGRLIMFAVKDGYLFGGWYQSAAVPSTHDPKFNKTMMNAILAAGKKPAVLD